MCFSLKYEPLWCCLHVKSQHLLRQLRPSSPRPMFLPMVASIATVGDLALWGTDLGLGQSQYIQLANEIIRDFKNIQSPINTLQEWIESLAAFGLQNPQALDLLKAQHGGSCLFLEEECCCYATKLEIAEKIPGSYGSDSNKGLKIRWVPLAGGIFRFSPFMDGVCT